MDKVDIHSQRPLGATYFLGSMNFFFISTGSCAVFQILNHPLID